ALRLLKLGGLVIVSDTIRPPISASLNREVYDKNKLLDYIRSYAETLVVPAQELATKAGNPRAANMVVLGVFHKSQNFITDASIRKAIAEVVPPKWLESSLKAFEFGLSL
ncbi:MAG: 2-oxoacid:acceptor oxidoreductase family protein, partial [Sulfolobales archaeon]